MDAANMKQLKEVMEAFSEAKQKDLRKPLPIDSLTRRERRNLFRECATAAENDIPDADLLLRALILREIAEAVYGGASGLDQKLSRFTEALNRKLR